MGRKDAFRRAMEAYLEEVRLTRSEATHCTYRKVLRLLYRTTREIGITTDLRRWGLLELSQLLSSRAHTLPSTRRTEIAALRGMFRQARLTSLEDLIRSGRVRLPPPSRARVRFYDQHTLDTILSATSGQLRLMVVLMAMGGLRRKEVVAVRMEDIQGDNLVVRGKGEHVMTIPLTSEMLVELDQWMAQRVDTVTAATKRGCSDVPEELLIYRYGSRLSPYKPGTVTEKIRALGHKLGVPLSPHDLRRSCGTELYKVCRDIVVVNRLLRHASLDQTRRYIDASLEDTRGAMEARERFRAKTAPRNRQPVNRCG